MAWKQQKQQIRISKKEKLTRYKNELKQKKKTPYAQQSQVILVVTFTAFLMARKERKGKNWFCWFCVPIWKEP